MIHYCLLCTRGITNAVSFQNSQMLSPILFNSVERIDYLKEATQHTQMCDGLSQHFVAGRLREHTVDLVIGLPVTAALLGHIQLMNVFAQLLHLRKRYPS